MTRIHISDLDGTLLRNDATLSPFARETLTRLLGEGLLFTVASARSQVSIRQILGELPLTLPVIEYNGAFLSDLRTGEHLMIRELPGEIVEEVHALGSERGLVPIVSSTDGRKDRLSCQGVTNAGLDWYVAERIHFQDERFRSVPDVRPCLGERVMMLTYIDRREALDPLAEAIRARWDSAVMFDFYENRYSPGWHWLTVQDGRASKGEGLRALAEREGFSLEDTVVFGDALNDLPMLEVAGRSVAVANAVDEVRAAADEVIGTNEEDSVVKWILKGRRG
jgi:Cof subfamily protein (haloacid dehalogenase superfamily)